MNVNRVAEHWSSPKGVQNPNVNLKVATFTQERNIPCLCNCCGAWLVFQADRTGEMVNCPQCFMGTVLYVPEQYQAHAPSKTDFEFRRIQWEDSGHGTRCIAGELINRAEHGFDWVRVRFALYNNFDAVIGVASDLVIGCAAAAVWKFRAAVFDDQVTRASLPVISTEFGCEQDEPFHAYRARHVASHDRDREDQDLSLSQIYGDVMLGKARNYGSVEQVKPAHWSQVRRQNNAEAR